MRLLRPWPQGSVPRKMSPGPVQMDSGPSGDYQTRLRAVRLCVWAVWSILLVCIFLSSVGDSPLRLPPKFRVLQLSLAPEGWAFFTRSPREPSTLVYRVVDGRLERLTFGNTSRRNLFGVSRSARAFDAEVGLLLTPVLSKTWQKCSGDPTRDECWRQKRPLKLINWSSTRYIDGEVVLISQAPVPWAWSSSQRPVYMPSKVLHLLVAMPSTTSRS